VVVSVEMHKRMVTLKPMPLTLTVKRDVQQCIAAISVVNSTECIRLMSTNKEKLHELLSSP